MRVATLMTMLAAPLALAACNSGEEAAETDDMPMTESMPADDTAMMGQDAAMRTASAEGTVTAIDAEAGTITIDHGPVAAIEWPAMTMAFQADEAARGTVAVGDEVTFDFEIGDAGSRIVSISKK
ncbi:MAG TPA: copper-binding protein [Alteraurantiacibacter sp.]